MKGRARLHDSMRAALDSVPAMSDAALDQTLAQAMEQARAGAQGMPRTAAGDGEAVRWWWPRPVLALAATAMAAALVLIVVRPGSGPAPAAPVAGSAAVARLVDGELVAADGGALPLAVDGRLADGASVRATRPSRMAMEGTGLGLEPGTSVQLHLAGTAARGARRVQLRSGAVRGELTAGAVPLVIDARAFAVEAVAPARFRVELDAVRVEAGQVRVLDRDGSTLLAVVTAGQSYPPAPVPAPAPAPAPETPPPATASPDGEPAAAPEPPPRARPAVLLAAARRSLARREVARARRQALRALASRPDRAEQAEGKTLLAECALVSGKRAQAVRDYLAIARRFPSLPAGENALFAAARLEAQLGQKREGRQHLEQYRRRYPQGRFADEVAGRLKAAR
jgi:TolA-binding protein